jgi:hypothetical protein
MFCIISYGDRTIMAATQSMKQSAETMANRLNLAIVFVLREKY